MHETVITIPVMPSFRLDFTVWVLRRRPKNTIDVWDGQRYSRVFILDDVPVKVAVLLEPAGERKKTAQLLVTLRSHRRLSTRQRADATTAVHKTLGLDTDVRSFYTMSVRHPDIERLARQFVGVRPPRFPTVFEALVNAIACQQVSLDVGILLLSRLSEKFGLEFIDKLDTMHAFPRPEDLFDIPEEDFKLLGFSYQKARAIRELAFAIVNGDIQLDSLESATNDEVLACLQKFRGIGRWSAEYVLLRGLGRLDVFPGDDIGGQNNVQKLLGLTFRPDYERLKSLTVAWSPYAGFVYFHLLLDKLHAKELV